ncbi:MAG: 4-hydroxythreonine-4-phosphate dehydrogenase PdxA [Aquisalimonadaceae bacterium]
MSQVPIVAVTLGDANGVGPEVVVNAVAGSDRAVVRPLLIGDGFLARRAIELLGMDCKVHSIESLADARFAENQIDVLETHTLSPADISPGQCSAACGTAVLKGFDVAAELARTNAVGGMVFGPVNADSIKLTGLRNRLVSPDVEGAHLLLVSGALRVAHLTDHMPLRRVIEEEVKRDKVGALIALADETLQSWGIERPRIALAGLNPHCVGDEDRDELIPAVARAVASGINVVGPVAPDSVFRQCVEGDYDIVIALYHDQGHIAIKTWGFEGNCAVYLGAPFLLATVAHGSAYDIAWSGRADSSMMRTAVATVASLAAGRGFS